jgi:SH3 domain protein
MKWFLARATLQLIIGLGSLLSAIPPVQAQTVRYISDQLEVPLLAGASDQHKTLLTLSSGNPVHVLATDRKTDYSRVRTSDGKQGWIANRYLMDTPSARQSLAEFQTANDNLQKQLYALTLEKNNLDAECSQFRAEHQNLTQELAQVRKLAGGDLELDKQNQVLQERVVQLERELQILQQENVSLLQSSDNSLFLMGAGILGGGLMLGVFLSGLGSRKREPWYEI